MNALSHHRPARRRVHCGHAVRFVALAFLIAGATARDVAAQTAYETTRLESLQVFGGLYRAGRTDDAMAVLGRYLEQAPCDAVMRYNLACLQAMSGDVIGASGQLDRTFALGYEPLERALDDPDLQPLFRAGILEDLVERHRQVRQEMREAASRTLVEGQWSETVALRPVFDSCGNELAVDVAFVSDPAGLTIRVDTGFDTGVDPSSLVLDLVVGVPRGPDTWSTERVRVFSGDLDTALPMVRWNRRDDLRDAGTTHVTTQDGHVQHRVAWSDLPGVGPPLDAVVAVNVQVRRRDDPLGAVALVADPYLRSDTVRARRHADLTILPDDPAAPWLRGHAVSSSVIGDSLALEVGVQGLPAIDASLRWTLRAVDPVTGERTEHAIPVRQRSLESELAFFGTTLGLDEVPAGALEVELELTADGIDPRTWSTTVLHLDTEWFLRGRHRLDALDREVERPIVEYKLFQVLESVRGAHADDPIGSLVAELSDVETLLARVEETGSALPPLDDTPSAVAVAFLAGETAMAPARLIRPARDARVAGSVVLTVLPRSVSSITSLPEAPQLAGRARLEIDVVDDAADPTFAPTRIAHAERWLRALAETDSVLVTGFGAAAAPVVRYALEEAPAITGVHVVVERAFDPWPGVALDAIDASGDGTPPIVLMHVQPLDDASRARIDALRAKGFVIETRRANDADVIRHFLRGMTTGS